MVWTHEGESATNMCHAGLVGQRRAYCVTSEIGALDFCCMPSSLTQGTFDPWVELLRQHFLSECVHIPPPSAELADPLTATMAVTITFCNPKHTELVGGAKRRGTKCFLRDKKSPASLSLSLCFLFLFSVYCALQARPWRYEKETHQKSYHSKRSNNLSKLFHCNFSCWLRWFIIQPILSNITNKVPITSHVPVKLCVAAVRDILWSLSDAFEWHLTLRPQSGDS